MIEVDTIEQLPTLTEEQKGSYATVGRGCLRWMYTFIWDFKKGEGHWSFMCFQDVPAPRA